MTKWLVAAAVLAAVLVAGTVWALLWRSDGHGSRGSRTASKEIVEGGPLAPPEVRSRGIFPIELGVTYTWGEVVLRNRGTVEVTLDQVELVGKTPGLTVLEMRAVRPIDQGGLLTLMPGRPDGPLALEGLVLKPGRDNEVALQVGLRLDARGSEGLRRVRVRYHDAVTRYVATFEQALVLCAPGDRFLTRRQCLRG